MGTENVRRIPGTQAIERTLDVLECFLHHPDVGVTELARIVDLSPSTTHRIVRALVARGYLEQDDRTDRYHLGRSTIVLGQAGRRYLGLDQVLPIIERFAAETGESVNMGLLDGHHVVVALRVQSRHPLRFDQPVGSRIQVHCSSMGKALLAFDAPNGPATLDELALTEVTEATITTVAELEVELGRIRDRGHSTDQEESIVGVSCVGAPVLDLGGRAVAAIAVQAPTARMSKRRAQQLGRQIRDVAAEITGAMQLDLHGGTASGYE